MDVISTILNQLDEWRHLPAYQLERRVDVLFGMFLPTVIGMKFDVNPDKCSVIPEFPLHKGKLEGSNNNQSMNVDFAAFFEKGNGKHLCLVELKTDQKSISVNQIKMLGEAKTKAGARNLLVGVLEAAKASSESRKYAHLIWKLHEIGCIELPDPDGFRQMSMTKERPGLTGKTGQLTRLGEANVSEAWGDADIHLIGIVPRDLRKEKRKTAFAEHELCHITFKTLAETIRKATVQPFGVEFAETFANFLDRWNKVPAGVKRLSE